MKFSLFPCGKVHATFLSMTPVSRQLPSFLLLDFGTFEGASMQIIVGYVPMS